MLRVYSILYIEKLWKPSPTSLLQELSSAPSSLHITSASLIEQEEAIVDEEEDEIMEVSQVDQITEVPEQEVEVEYEEQPGTTASTKSYIKLYFLNFYRFFSCQRK